MFLILQQKMIIITRKQKAKETKAEKITSAENLTGYNDIVCKFILIVHIDLMSFMCKDRNHSICYTITTYEVHTFKKKKKRKSVRDIFVYQFLFYICLFVAINLL